MSGVLMSPSRKIEGVKCFNSSYIITKWFIVLNNIKSIIFLQLHFILAQMRLQLFSHTAPVLTPCLKWLAVQERLRHVVISENYKDNIAAVKMAAASVPQTRTRISQSHKKAGGLETHTHHSSASCTSLYFPQTSSISLLCHLFIFLPPLPLSRSHSFPD